jgi:cell division protein FtsI/penicillin-binding protein 2
MTLGLLMALALDLTLAMKGKPGVAIVARVSDGRVLASYHLDRGRATFPGSTLKPFTMKAWIEAHPGTDAPRLACPRKLRIAGRKFDCIHPDGGIPLDPPTALAYSCNAYFAHLGLELKPAAFAQSLRRIAKTVSLAATPAELQMQALGEWGIEMTPLELLTAYRRLALEFDNPALAPVFAGLSGAVEYGSAQPAAVEGLRVAGKTGTGTGHAWFAGFAQSPGASKPEIVVVVFLEGGHGGPDAAPIAREIFSAWERERSR